MAAVCDLDADGARACAERYGISAVFTDWRDLLGHPLDAVIVLTSGSHGPIAEAAARAGLHVFVEKPMCFSAAEGRAMVAAADQAGVKLIVGYPKRYDPAFARMREETARLTSARMLRVTTFESPLRPYIAHYPLLPRAPLPGGGRRRAAGRQRQAGSRPRHGGQGAGRLGRRPEWAVVLLDGAWCMNSTPIAACSSRSPPGYEYVKPGHGTRQRSCDVQVSVALAEYAIHWIDLPGIARYGMEFALYAPDERLRLTFPSPFLRNEPATLEIEDGTAGSARAWRTEEIASYESGFKLELEAFHDWIVSGREPVAATGRACGRRAVPGHHRLPPSR